MSVGRRLAGYSGMRIDWPHLRSIESAVSHDFDMLTRGLMTGLNKPYLIRGFRLKIPQAATNASNLQIEVADSVVLHSSATESGTILQVAAGTPDETLNAQNPKVIGAFQANAINYVSLDYRRVTDSDTIDQTAGWSPSQQLEYQRAVPIGRILQYRFIISTSGFSTNLPLYMVKTTVNGSVDYVTKGVTDFFRLGSGGANPNPQNSYNWGNLVNSQIGADPAGRREWISPTLGDNPLTVRPGDNPLAFDYGDFAIKNLKEWMDAVMTRFKEITGSDYWYLGSQIANQNLNQLSFDAINSVLTGTGEISYNLVLESTPPSDGAFQSVITDPSVQPGDVYVQGVDSGTKATMTDFNEGRLLVNSMTSAGFIFGEELFTRRRFRPTVAQWRTLDYTFGADRYASLYRRSASIGPLPNNIASWSYVNHSAPTGLFGWTICTVTTTAPHGFNPSDFVRIEGLVSTATLAPDAVHSILSVPSTTSFTFITNFPQSGAATVAGANGVVLDTNDRHPYSAKLAITDFQSGGGNIGLVSVPGHSFLAPQSVTGDFNNTSNIIQNVSDVSNLRVGALVTSANLTGGEGYILRIDPTLSEIEVSSAATATVVGASFTSSMLVHIRGLQATGLTSAQLNGQRTVIGIGPNNELEIDYGAPIVSPIVDVDAYANYVYHAFIMALTGAAPVQYNVTDILALSIVGDTVQFKVGPDTLPALGFAAGTLQYDGVVAQSLVADPVRVQSITNDGAGNLTVTTYVPHGVQTAGPVSFTIFGNSELSEYIRSYTNVNLVNVSPTVFEINGTGIVSVATYTNPGSDNTFAKFADNPYAGPVQWSSDMVVKGIFGDLSFTIPRTAVVDTSDPAVSPTANQFNVNGQTGTAYLQDGEVLYIKLKRNLPISNNTIFSTMGGDSTISTASIMTDVDNQALEPGDFIKFSDEADSHWLKIKTINPTAVVLETDRGQEPDIIQRPARSGRMIYSKGTYNLTYVKKHHLVEADSSTYWLAMRRDNNGPRSKVYFRNLEIEAGEVRQINDNSTSNLLLYTGAMNEGAINPNYTVSDTSGDFQYSTALTVEAIDDATRMVTFSTSPAGGFQRNDRVVYFDGVQFFYFTIRSVVSSRSVIMITDTADLTVGNSVNYLRENKFIQDTDNLTLAQRKEDRQAGNVDTVMNRPIYDESMYLQQINLAGAGTVRSGSYVYKGPQTNPTALAWVVHGNAAVSETIEDALITMPGGHVTLGPDAIIVNIVYGSFQHGDGLFQNGSVTGRTVDNSGNPPFLAPPLYGDNLGGGVELVLPPNKRTQVKSGSGFVVFGTHSFYKASADASLTGEELLIIVNDGIREAHYDYTETFGGPKAKIRLARSTPPNTRLRARLMSSFGSAVVTASSDVTLQSAYNAGSTIQTTGGRPVEITSDDVNGGSKGLIARGSIGLNGGINQAGGIFNELGDQTFVIGKETDKPKESWTGLEAVKTHSSHAGSALKTKTAAQVVTGNVGTVIAGSEVTIADQYATRIKISATARRSDGTMGVAGFSMEGTFYRDGGGALAAGQPTSLVTGFDGDGAAYAIAFGLSGNDVVAVVFGTVGSTIQWVLTIESQSVGVA